MIEGHWAISAIFLLLLQPGCSHPGLQKALRQGVPASPVPTQLLAVYEPWFGHPHHISVGYSSQDPAVIRKQMEQALAALSEAERTAFVMRHWEGCGIEEIAGVLKSSSNATKNTVFRAVQKLRRALQPVVETRAQARAMGTES